MIIALAGLPASGKSYFARKLVEKNENFVVLDKDIVRATLFPGKLTTYTRTQDDFCVDVILKAAHEIIKSKPYMHVIIDGRTFSKKYQVEQVYRAAEAMNVRCKFVEFVCNDKTVKARLESPENTHVAKNRNYKLYVQLKKEAKPLVVPHLTLCSDDDCSIDERFRKFLEYIAQ